ncbi:MAG: exodeoxyribonuclease V subunit alpha [Gammaproteobacteria bacterium]|nr:exodeoxyribonuclease V subunit alpha [Gammaproteobacteria bacterium]
MSDLLRTLLQQQQLRPLDLHFARLIARLEGEDAPLLELVAALTSHAVAAGDVCLPLRELAGRRFGDEQEERLPPLEELAEKLHRSRVVGAPGEFKPLILEADGRLYLQRFWHYEVQLADALLARAGHRFEVDEAALARDLQRLFPSQEPAEVDWQAVAAAVAVLRGLTVISGGPGSGKTSTVVRLLALLQQQAGNGLEIALAAPTGKAAARLQESIRQAKQRLSLAPATLAAIPEQAQTLHRLLGMRPAGGAMHDADNPLGCDALIVDEASMVDLAMMVRLVRALPSASRLILLGDRHQLASVEAGAVLGDICGAAGGCSAGLAAQLARVGLRLPASPNAPTTPMNDSVVLLQRSYRFDADSAIGRLASAINGGDAEAVLRLLRDADAPRCAWSAPQEPLLPLLLEGYRPYLELAANGAPPEVVFTAFNAFRLLTAANLGERGAERINAMVERALVRDRATLSRDGWYPGRPLVIRANDYDLGLYNGDIGLLLQDSGGRPRLCFPAAGGGFRWFSANRLPRHELAYAMTVHKSQGSEYDSVLLVLPDADSPLLTRELLYTAVTRARGHFSISAGEAEIRTAVARRLQRVSGLRDRLWPPAKA